MKIKPALSLIGALALLSSAGATAATAAELPAEPGVVISGQHLTTADGLTVVEHSYPVGSGGQVGENLPTTSTPGGVHTNIVLGSSYAFSEEQLYVEYVGTAKAAANVYQGQRIIQMCYWWTRTGATSPTTCATATFVNGSWRASGEVHSSFSDSLGSNVPQTIFHVKSTRIDPRG
ncbi:hypothetical protein AAEP80_02805 [Curtobacterium sp. L3-7]|uniref:hypothetical protein n=1 Tax=Curtobacterium sp. L3-7 TaxID=3138787 RepID=UPI003B52F77F